MKFRFVAALLIALVSALPADGHDSPEHVVDDLTVAMARHGRSPELLYRRATEYRVLGQLKAAIADLRAAVELNSSYLPAYLELGRVELARGEPAAAGKHVDRAERLAKSPAERAAVHMLRCEILLATRQPEKSLEHCQQACRLNPGDVEWLLRRSHIQAQLGRHDDRLRDLKAAREQNPSIVLQIEFVEAQIEAGHHTQALRHIEAELADSRWQSSWRIRRARVRRALGQRAAAAEDLQYAIAEIDQRLNPRRPDVTLLIDRGHAYALLGDRKTAEADLAAARHRHVDEWSLRRLTAALAAMSSPAPRP